MSFITKNQLATSLQVIKTLISFKADKDDLDAKIDKSETSDPIGTSAELGLVTPIMSEEGLMYTSEKGEIYSL